MAEAVELSSEADVGLVEDGPLTESGQRSLNALKAENLRLKHTIEEKDARIDRFTQDL